jgi:hypothetical protein
MIPPYPNLHIFANGISNNANFSAGDYRSMMKVSYVIAPLVSLQSLTLRVQVILPLVDAVTNDARITLAFRSFVEWHHLAVAEVHTDTSLERLETALESLSENLRVFEKYSDSNLKFIKMHMLTKYAIDIRSRGTVDNYSTEISERQHIKDAKDPFRSSNHRDAVLQVTTCYRRSHSNALRKRSLMSAALSV